MISSLFTILLPSNFEEWALASGILSLGTAQKNHVSRTWFFEVNLVAPQKVENRRMAFLRHLAQIAVPASLNEHEFRVGYFFREDFCGLDVAARAALVSVLAADDHQSGRIDLVNQVGRFMTLPRHHMAQITL